MAVRGVVFRTTVLFSVTGNASLLAQFAQQGGAGDAQRGGSLGMVAAATIKRQGDVSPLHLGQGWSAVPPPRAALRPC